MPEVKNNAITVSPARRRNCSFCGKPPSEVRAIVAGCSPTCGICNDCVADAYIKLAGAITRDTNAAADALQEHS